MDLTDIKIPYFWCNTQLHTTFWADVVPIWWLEWYSRRGTYVTELNELSKQLFYSLKWSQQLFYSLQEPQRRFCNQLSLSSSQGR